MTRGFRRLFLAALAAVAAVSAGACASRKGSAPPPEPSFVVFTNQASDQAAVYARRGGGSEMVRIGSVASGRTETLRVPVTLSRDGSLSIVARLLARRGTISSGEFVMRPGERVSVTLGAAANILTVLPIPQPEP